MQLIKCILLHDLIQHPDADDIGMTELVLNGYEEDMKTMYIRSDATGEDEVIEVDRVTITSAIDICWGNWINGRLYCNNEDSLCCTGFTIEGQEGIWIIENS